MNKLLFPFLFLCLLNTTILAQSCYTDSVVIRSTDFHNFSDGQTITTEHYSLLTGIMTSSGATATNSTFSAPSISTTPFIRNYIERTAFRDTLVYFGFQGTGSGFDNLVRIEFAYDANENPITRLQYNGSGNTWLPYKNESWTYNSDSTLNTYVTQIDTGIGWINNDSATYIYANGRLQEKVIQKWNGTAWENYGRFTITFNISGIQDSLYYERWDTTNLIFTDSLRLFFDPVNDLTANYSSGNQWVDFTSITFDTLTRITHYETSATNGSDIKDFDFYKIWPLTTYFYVDYGCLNYGDQFFDDHGVYIGHNGGSVCFHPATSDENLNYDSLYILRSRSYSYTTMVSDGYGTTGYRYSSSDTVILSIIPLASLGAKICQGAQYYSAPILYGGCGPLQVQWSPSYGLSSDTTLNPLITADSSVTYTVTVSDSTGHTAVANFVSQVNVPLVVMCDTLLCPGCPVVLTADLSVSGNYTYAWYRNGVAIPGATADTFTVFQDGNYTVRVRDLTPPSCYAYSNAVPVFFNQQTRLNGYVYLENDTNCSRTIADSLSSVPQTLKIERGLYSLIFQSDSTGYFDIPIDTGTFTLSLLNTSSYVFSCPSDGDTIVFIPLSGDTITQDLSLRDLTLNVSLPENISVLIYPNPAKDRIYIDSSVPITHISMLDLTGKEIAVMAKENPIIVNGLARGIYFLKIETRDRFFYGKVLLD